MSLKERIILPAGTFGGRPQPIGSITEADCLLMQELGSSPELKSNLDIVDYVFAEGADPALKELPIFASGSIAKILHRRRLDHNLVYAFEGPSADNTAENLGTYGEWYQFAEQAAEVGGLNRPILATSAYNVGNSYRQGRLFGIEGIIPENLPRSFDWRSEQIWTKNWALWVLTSHLRINRLMSKGH